MFLFIPSYYTQLKDYCKLNKYNDRKGMKREEGSKN